MRQPPSKICPLLSIGRAGDPAPCQEDHCAWFHIEVDPEDGTADGACALVSIADTLATAKKELPGATNTEQLKQTQHNT